MLRKCLLQLLLGAEVAGVATLLLATVGGSWRETSIAPVDKRGEMFLQTGCIQVELTCTEPYQ